VGAVMAEVPSKDAPAREGGPVPPQQGTLLTLAAMGLIVEHLDQPIFAKDGCQRFVLVNGAFCDLVESTRATLLHQCEVDVLPVTPPSPLEQAVFDHGTPTGGLRTFTTSSGVPLVRHTTLVPLIDGQGAVTHVVGVVGRPGEPVTNPDQFQEELERYAVERTTALRAMQQDLLRRERMWVLSQVAAGLAHQLRNHLAAITNAVSIVRKHVAATDKVAHQALELAYGAAFESSTTIGDLLDYTKPRTSKPMVVSLKEVVTDALELTPPPSGVVITSDRLDVDIFVDPHQVRDALRKVIRNAYEAMAGKGELRLSVEVDADSNAPMVELRIADTGVGVSEQHRDLLFEPMITSKPLGLGLGLASALALVTQQGGTIECLRGVDAGACFALRFPTAGP
jgi:signal transduction histidine kinase